MNEMQQQVRKFTEELEVPMSRKPEMWDRDLRKNLIAEEAIETIHAIDARDFEGAIDGLCDMLYVIFQAANVWGIDLQEFFDEVHGANMAKEGGGKRRDGKIMKPACWKPPEIESVLARQKEAAA